MYVMRQVFSEYVKKKMARETYIEMVINEVGLDLKPSQAAKDGR